MPDRIFAGVHHDAVTAEADSGGSGVGRDELNDHSVRPFARSCDLGFGANDRDRSNEFRTQVISDIWSEMDIFHGFHEFIDWTA